MRKVAFIITIIWSRDQRSTKRLYFSFGIGFGIGLWYDKWFGVLFKVQTWVTWPPKIAIFRITPAFFLTSCGVMTDEESASKILRNLNLYLIFKYPKYEILKYKDFWIFLCEWFSICVLSDLGPKFKCYVSTLRTRSLLIFTFATLTQSDTKDEKKSRMENVGGSG